MIVGRKSRERTNERIYKYINRREREREKSERMSFVSLGFEPTDKVYQSTSGLNYTSLLSYEKKFFDEEYVNSRGEWMRANWHMSIYYATAYIVAIFVGQAYMRGRERFELRGALVAWNLFLAVFSLVGTVRTWPEFINALTTQGLTHTMCSPDYTYGVFGCWGWYLKFFHISVN